MFLCGRCKQEIQLKKRHVSDVCQTVAQSRAHYGVPKPAPRPFVQPKRVAR